MTCRGWTGRARWCSASWPAACRAAGPGSWPCPARGVNALGGTITEAAWRIKPSWYLVVTDDKMIPPPAQRSMAERTGATVTEVPGSHSIYVSQPQAVAALITEAASAARG